MKRFYTKLFVAVFCWFTAYTAQAQTYLMSTAPVSTCTGTFTDDGGAAGNYVADLTTIKTFTPTTAGSKLRATFTSFDIEEGYDQLYVFDGPDINAPLINIYTGTVSPGTITATNSTGQLTFAFVSDQIVVSTGWTATLSCVSTVSSGMFSMSTAPITTCNASWFDPAGSSAAFNYASGVDNTQTINPGTAGSKVRVAFSAFDLATTDFLYVYDGTSTAATLLATYTGSSIPATVTATNATGALTFRFTSNTTTVAGAGWAAAISCFTPATGTAMSTTPITACNGTWQDPGGNGDYANLQNITQTFTPATSGSKVRITFNSFNIETGYDLLYVFDGPTTASPLINIFNGTINPGTVTATNATGQLTFQFVSDNIIVASGWDATISCVTTAPAPTYSMSPASLTTCGATWYDGAGSSTNIGYGINNNITQTINPSTTGSKVRVTFSAFNLVTSDFLEVYDGTSTTATLIGIYTGTSLPPVITATNSAGALTFRFTSSATTTGAAGWTAAISCVTTTTGITMSNNPITTCSGTWLDTGGNGDYPLLQETIQTFTPATSGSKMRVNFTSFDLETGYDVLYVYDGPSISAPLINVFTGITSPGIITATNATGQLTFRFISDNTIPASGWTATLSCVTTTVTSVYSMSNAPLTTCGAAWYDIGGSSSDLNYGNNQTFTQTITPSTAGSKLKITFSAFSLENGVDFLYVYNGPSTASPLVATLTGTSIPAAITSTATGGQLTFRFVSNATISAAGWVSALSCVAAPVPTITSFTPSSGPVGTTVTITGTNFTGANSVTLNGATVVFSITNPTTIVFTVPSGASTGLISVTTPNGTATSSTNFTVTVPCVTPSASITTACTTGTSQTVSIALTGSQPWTVNYTINGAPQTASGITATPYVLTVTPTAATTYTLTGVSSGTCTGTASGSVTISPKVTPTASGNTGCANTQVSLTANGAPTGGSYRWYTSPSITTPITGATTATYLTPALSASTTYYVSVINAQGCEGSRTAVTATITALPTVNAGTAQTICANAAPVALTGFSPAGGTWSGNGVNAAGLFTPSAALVGNVTLTYTVTVSGCTGTSTKTITVNAAPTVNAGTAQTVCANANPITLAGFSPAGGDWSGNGVSSSGIFTPSAALIGTQTLTYTVTSGGCTSSATKTITVNTVPTANAGATQTICANAAPVTLTGFSPAGGTWSGNGVSAGGVFTPSSSLVGAVTLTYTVTQGGCSASSTKTVNVTATPSVVAGSDLTICSNAALVTLTGYSPTGGTWSGVGVSPTGEFDPSASGAGSFPLTYTVNVGGCSGSSTITLNVTAAPATPAITVLPNNVLESSVTGTSYEWRRNNIQLAPTTRSITATANGTYTVKVINPTGCNSDVSAGLSYTLTAIGDNFAANSLTVFPNPTTGLVNIKLEGLSGKAHVQVVNMLGQQIATGTLTNSDNAAKVLDLTGVAKGVYLIKVKTGDMAITKKLLVE